MNRMLLIARNEGRMMRRNRVAQLAVLMLLLLSVVATLTSVAHREASDALRARFQAQADRAFDGQPARHPHRMVHYGHFVFRPLPPLAAFDPGVDPFTGSTIFLEGHRQNSANFGDVRQSSLLARFGSLTPAFVLQVLAPLVLIFVGFGAIAREREQGTLRVLKAHGTSATALMAGKVLALGAVAALMLLPALLSLAWLVAIEGAAPPAALALGLGYAAYLLLWTVGIVATSSMVGSARTALMALLGLWAFAIVLVPRVAPDMALAMIPTPTRLETDIAIHRDLRRIGDSHDPDDPHFKAFKAQVLDRYGVDKVEDLPVNYRGLLAMEGERLTSGLFDTYARAQFDGERDQSRIVAAFGLISPTIGLRSLSMALAGTDLEAHRRFLQQAEAYRYAIVQQLNRLQAEAVTYADDGRRNSDPAAGRRVRFAARHWHDNPHFAYRGPALRERLAAALPGAAILFVWTLLVGLALHVARRRLGRVS